MSDLHHETNLHGPAASGPWLPVRSCPDFGGRLLRWVLFLIVSTGGVAAAQDDDEEPFRPGLIGRYEPAGEVPFERVDREIAFDWEGGTPDSRVPPGALKVQWRGRLQSQANGEYRFHVYFAGKLKLQLNGETILDASALDPAWSLSRPVRLSFGYHTLLISYERTRRPARVGLYWSGPQFSLEPIHGRQLFHDVEERVDTAFDRGETLVRALRCGACHVLPGTAAPPPAPSLERLAGTMHPEWLVQWLTANPAAGTPADPAAGDPARRMPHFQLTPEAAQQITDWLFVNAQPVAATPPPRPKPKPESALKAKKKRDQDQDEVVPPPRTPEESGRELFLSLGCLACHAWEQLGTRGLWDGGDLSAIAAKRPAPFFAAWLATPQAINPQHRMPIFDLTDEERSQLAAFLGSLRPAAGTAAPLAASDTARDSRKEPPPALTQSRCHACHAVPGSPQPGVTEKLPMHLARWDEGCVGKARGEHQPRFVLSAPDQMALLEFLAERGLARQPVVSGAQLLREHNCLACHQRADSAGLAPQLERVGQRFPALAPQIPALTPPALHSVGDKLHESALRDAITRTGVPHRPYLHVRMPRFPLRDGELSALLQTFLTKDRIPDDAPSALTTTTPRIAPGILETLGHRLVTPDGFGCTSCHQVGDVQPAQAPLNARGPSLSMLGKRVRRSWFDRFVRNPARITPRMEMPSVQVAVRGVVPESLDDQLAAVWEVLNKPGFQPPQPNPVRVLRQTGTQPAESARIVTDIVRTDRGSLLKPLLVGLSNRHNALLDLETARLASWSIGDTARQRTEGKTWFWELAGKEIFVPAVEGSELTVVRGGQELAPQPNGQFLTEIDRLEHAGNQLRWEHRLHFGQSPPLQVRQTLAPWAASPASGFRRTIEVSGLAPGDRLRWRLARSESLAGAKWSDNGSSLSVTQPMPLTFTLYQPTGAVWEEGTVTVTADDGKARIEVGYATTLPIDQFPQIVPPVSPVRAEPLDVVPGFAAVRLPLHNELMPTALGWRPDGTLVIASLKGQVWEAVDSDGDQLADQLSVLSDGWAAPYGLHVAKDYVDVANKHSVIRLHDDDGDRRAERAVTIASGWGHTADYHDWAVGLPRDPDGSYYLALPCQQDQRSVEAAHWRGHFLRLVPRTPTPENPRSFQAETISRGHRFPMGIARRRDGQLFVTDNQGNYNPFNELNHVRPGAHFGFINALERGGAERPPLTPPAVNLPHPWVRSVNGICFLESPPAEGSKPEHRFGPFEGHLIGCEYDTRRLIRMSLQQVGDTFQGAAYPFSLPAPEQGEPFLGPLVCAVSPDGDLYVGGIRDSGWGGANNIGEVVRLRMHPEALPCGIAEMQATPTGFSLRFTTPVDPAHAARRENFSLSSYRRESTPAYGGPDLDRRTERIRQIDVAEDGRRMTLQLDELRTGFVYELHVKNLLGNGDPFFPAEAHYTLHEVPRFPATAPKTSS